MKDYHYFQSFEGHEGAILAVSFTPDGKWVASGGEDGKICFWEKTSLARCWQASPRPILALAFHPQEPKIACSNEHGVTLWNYAEKRWIMSLDSPSWVSCLSFDSSGQWLAFGTYDRSVVLWKMQGDETTLLLAGHTQEITALAFCPNNTKLVSASADKTMRLWDTRQGQCLLSLQGHTSVVTAVSFCKDGKMASSSWDRTVRVWNTLSGECLRILRHSQAVTDVLFCEDGKILSVCGWDDSLGKGASVVSLWDWKEGQCLEQWYCAQSITKMDVSPDRTRFVCADSSGFLHTSDLAFEKKEEVNLPCIVAVDDDEWILRLIQAALKKEYRVLPTLEAEEGLALARKEKPVLLILDVMMPQMDGWTLLQKLRMESTLAITPILFLTALDSPENRMQGLRLGATDYMTKPFQGNELLVRVHSILQWRHQIEKTLREKWTEEQNADF